MSNIGIAIMRASAFDLHSNISPPFGASSANLTCGKKASIEMHAIGGPVHRRRLHGLEALSWMENTFPGASVFHPPDPLDKVFHHFVSYTTTTTTTTKVYILPKDFILSIWEIWFDWYPMVWLAGCLEALTMSELASSDDPVIWLFDDLVIIHDSWWIMKQIIHDSLVMIVDGSKLASWYSSGHRGASQLFSTVQTFSESLGRVANTIFTECVCNGGHEGNTPPRPCLVKTKFSLWVPFEYKTKCISVRLSVL